MVEKALFDHSEFRIKWIDSTPVACCQVCIRLCGFLEFSKYFECNVLALDVSRSTGRPLREQPVRCKCCLGLLSDAEKRRLERSREFLYQVRGRLRSYCGACRSLLFYNAA